MRDEQVQRYARHLALPEIGRLGQTALLGSAARVELREPDPAAELVAATYLAAGGVGTVIVATATAAERADLAAHGPDTRVLSAAAPDAPPARDLVLLPRPAWWPSSDGDATALASYRGGAAAMRWMIDTIAR